MKKYCSLLIAIVFIFVNISIIVYADDVKPERSYVNHMEVLRARLYADNIGQNEKEKAVMFMEHIGFPENMIQSVPDEKKFEIMQKTSEVWFIVEYYKETENSIESVTKTEFNHAKNTINSISSIESGSNSGTDSYFSKEIAWIHNTDGDVYDVFVGFSWIGGQLVHYQDVITVASDGGNFQIGTSAGVIQYKETIITNNVPTYTDITTYLIEDDENGVHNGYLKYGFTLPNGSTSSNHYISYNNFNILIFGSMKVRYPTLPTNFMIQGTYFRKTFNLFSPSFSVGSDGLTVSISPSFVYKSYRITTSNIYYTP